MNPWLPALLGVLAAAIAALGAWAVAKRQRSGKIDTTEAADLWAEGQAMRHELREENVLLRTEVIALRSEATAWRVETLALKAKVEVLEDQVRILSDLVRGEILRVSDDTLHLPEDKEIES